MRICIIKIKIFLKYRSFRIYYYFHKIVNAEAREEVINNHRVNFTGCNDGLDNPTCGQMLINRKPIPFSQVRIKI